MLGLLLPDPTDPLCPPDFKEKARSALPRTLGGPPATNSDLQRALLDFIGTFSGWEEGSDPAMLAAARSLVRAAHGDSPLVVDPFSGGGSIPFEALRLQCETFASDLNPVACTILRTLLEELPRVDRASFAKELESASATVKERAASELRRFYPKEADGGEPIAYLWARTVRCEAPNCGAEIPLVRSFWLVKKAQRKLCLKPVVVPGSPPRLEFEITALKSDKDAPAGTVTRSNATCRACKSVLPAERVRAQVTEQRGGADVIFDSKGRRTGGARLLAVVTATASGAERQYRLPTEKDYRAVWEAMSAVAKLPPINGIPAVPDEPLPPYGTLGFRVQLYGMKTWGDLFSARQKLALASLAREVARISPESAEDTQTRAVRACLALGVDKQADYLSSLCTWHYHNREKVNHTFGRQTLSFVSDFVEPVFFGTGAGNWDGLMDWTLLVAKGLPPGLSPGSVQQASATAHPLPDDSAAVWMTDPPYYDSVPYSDLSDFFYVWLKRTLPTDALLRDPTDSSNPLTPKAEEAVQDESKVVGGVPKDRTFFERQMALAFAEGRRVLRDDGVGCVVFAHKTTEGWEALLTGLVGSGWVISGSWPLATEMQTRLRAKDSAALATSVHLICRPRSSEARVGDWADVARELPDKVREWMARLTNEGVHGADLVFSCIGPAMEVYSRYDCVVDAQDRPIPLGGDATALEPHKKGYLAHVWEVVGRLALEQILGSGRDRAALEEDARLTALFLWTLQDSAGIDDDSPGEDEEDGEASDEGGSSGGRSGWTMAYDIVRRFAQPLGIRLEDWEGRIIETQKGVVRLLPVHERAQQLFGEGGVTATTDDEQTGRRLMQTSLFGELAVPVSNAGSKKGRKSKLSNDAGDSPQSLARTTLDRVHVGLLLQASGKTAALRALLEEEARRGPDFERLSNALAALYPPRSEERRLVEAMLLAMPK